MSLVHSARLNGQCVATATDDVHCLCMLVRRKGELLDALLRRLDAAIINTRSLHRRGQRSNSLRFT
jgi:hypothetical protein